MHIFFFRYLFSETIMMKSMLTREHIKSANVKWIITAITSVSCIHKGKSINKRQRTTSFNNKTHTHLLRNSRISSRILSPLFVASSISIFISSIVSLYFSNAVQISSYFDSSFLFRQLGQTNVIFFFLP